MAKETVKKTTKKKDPAIAEKKKAVRQLKSEKTREATKTKKSHN